MMAKLRYPFNGKLPNASDDPWSKLDTIVEYLQDEPETYDLSSWLGEAVRLSGRDPIELLRRLGLKRGRGKPAADPNAWLTVGKRICELEDFGLNPDKVREAHSEKDLCGNPVGEISYNRMKPEAAIDKVSEENFGKFERSQLQKFRDAYRAAWHVAHNP